MESHESLHRANAENFGFQKIILIVGISLMAMKFIAWFITDSISILTDALESIVNVAAAIVGMYALYLSAIPRDSNHPFGHGKIENLSSLIEGSMIAVAGGIIIFQAVERIVNPKPLDQLDIGIILIGITAAVNFLVGYLAILKGKKNRSPALTASGKHLCSDTVSSVGIILGLLVMSGLTGMGYDVYWIDGAIASVFGVIILITGIRVVKESMDSSMDMADPEIVSNILNALNEDRHSDWIDIHNLRVIKYGVLIHVQMHMVIPKNMTIEEQAKEFDEVVNSIKRVYGDSVDVIIQAEPCTDIYCSHCMRECERRVSGFVSMAEWTLDTISDEFSSIEK